MNSWYTSRLKRAASLTEGKRAKIQDKSKTLDFNKQAKYTKTRFSFYLWCHKDGKLLAAPGSCCLPRTAAAAAAVRALYCLTEKTGLHQGSLEVQQ